MTAAPEPARQPVPTLGGPTDGAAPAPGAVEDGAVLLFGGVGVLARHASLITEARDRGYHVLAVSTGADAAVRLAARHADPGHPFHALADWLVLETAAVEPVVAAVRQRFAGYRVVAAVSCGEIFVEACGQLADAWGLAGPGLRASRVCRSKLLQRAYLPEYSPRSVYLAPGARGAAAELVPGYPAVVKPTGRMSSSGVRRVTDPEELAEAVAGFPADEALLLEELVDGPEYSVEALVHHGEIRWENVTGKLTTDTTGPYFTEMRHVVPAELEPAGRDSLLATNREILRRLDFGSGISHAEIRLSPTRGPVLMEIAARVPGDGVTLMFHLATGAPMEPVLLDLALGREPHYPVTTRRAVHQYLPTPPGILAGVHGPDGAEPVWISGDRWPEPSPAPAGAPARTAAVFGWLDPGTPVGLLRDSGDRAASVLLDLPLDAPVEPAVAAAAATVTVRVAPIPAQVRP